MTTTVTTTEIRRTLEVLCEPGAVYELRALEVPDGRYLNTVSGYFDDLDKLAHAAAKIDAREGHGVYITLNPVKPALLARAANRTRDARDKPATTDADVAHRRWLPLDLDVVGPKGISSTDEEHEATREVARGVYRALTEIGWPKPVAGDSGNGAHLLYRVDLPAKDDGLIEQVLTGIALRFTTEAVFVDESVFNPSRIWKVYGTTGRKGDNTKDRPHRVSRLLDVPDPLDVVTREQLEAVAAWAPVQPKPERKPWSGESFDIDSFIAQHLHDLKGPHAWSDGARKWVGPCPWDPAHSNDGFFIAEFRSGAIAARCLHNGCKGRGWHDLRALFEPGWTPHQAGDRVASQSIPSEAQPSEMLSSSGGVPAVERILGSFRTAPELAASGSATTQWVAEGVAPLGSITELVGAIKTSGKTTFVLGMCRAIVDGATFLDRPTRKMPVVYLTEERSASFSAALRRAKLDQCPDFHLLMWADTMGVTWAETVEAAVKKATNLEAILIVDTLTQWAGLRGESENSAGEALQAMVPLQLAASAGLAVIVVRHERKGGGELGESGRGSSAFGGAVDTLLRLKRPDGGSGPNVRVLEGVSRFDGVPSDLYIELTDDGTYAVLGTEAAYNKNRIREFLLEHAPVSEEHAQRVEDIIGEDSKIGKTTARDVAKELVEQGVFSAVGAGKKNDPVRFWMVPAEGSEPLSPTDRMLSSTYRTEAPAESISSSENGAGGASDDGSQFVSPQPQPIGAEESISAAAVTGSSPDVREV